MYLFELLRFLALPATLISAAVVIAPAASHAYRNFSHVRKWFLGVVHGTNNLGLFRSEIYDLSIETVQFADLVKVSRSFFGLKVTSVYSRKSEDSYVVKLREIEPRLFSGTWRRKYTNDYSGSAMTSASNTGFSGYMLGNSELTKKANVLRWSMTRTGKTDLDYPDDLIQKGPIDLKISSDGLERIIADHDLKPNDTFEFEQLKFDIVPNLCNPKHSTFSIPLLKCALTHPGDYDSVLDLGCGCGFYAIYYKSIGIKNVCAIDFQDKLETARSNAEKNLNKSDEIDFRKPFDEHTERVFAPLGRKDKYDVIIANMPMALMDKNTAHAESGYFTSFATNKKLWFNLVVGAKQHLTDTGAIYFAYGEAGDEAYMQYLIALSGLQSTRMEPVASLSSNRNYYIYRLSAR